MHVRGFVFALAIAGMWTSACAPSAPTLPTAAVSVSPTAAPSAPAATATTAPTAAASFTLTSSAFTQGANIPARFTCTGENASPPLSWSHAPANTQSFALIMDDPDAPAGTFTHWVAFDISPTQSEIAAGANSVGRSGKNSAGRNGYTGPCPPSGTHRYFFKLYALDLPVLGLNDGAARSEVEKAMSGHILAETQLMGRYSK
jgi:Raf kinase inhibitor-like YbhB/YbcL family protein